MSFGFLAALSRRRLLGGAGAIALLPAAGLRAAHSTATPSTVPPAHGDGDLSPAMTTELVLEIRADIAATVQVGESALGFRRLIPITGGTFSGPRLSGVVMPGGADWQLERPDGVTAVEARVTLQTSDGTQLSVTNRGVIVPAVTGSPAASCVPTVPEFEVPTGAHDWLNKSVFVGSLQASRDREGQVLIRVFRVT